ncbi:MAG TPA: hypothetical protein VJB61_22555, partial [Actinomycetota bacterium]
APPPSTEPTDPDEVDWSTVQVTLTEGQTRQFVTFYEGLQDFDDRAAQSQVTCPRLCFVGSADEITYDERWGGVRVSMADPVISRRAELESLGWQVQILEGLDHTRPCRPPTSSPSCAPGSSVFWVRFDNRPMGRGRSGPMHAPGTVAPGVFGPHAGTWHGGPVCSSPAVRRRCPVFDGVGWR